MFGFILPFVVSVFLIVESFKKSWSGNLKIINTVVAVILFLCALLVLLTKEMFLLSNNLGETEYLRNGSGPVVSAIASSCGGVMLLFATWLPFKEDMKFIDRN